MLVLIVSVAAVFAVGVNAHGRVIEPPGRATAWRFGFNTPINYNDHELSCGGFPHQHELNDGKCGICGDPWDAPLPRPHEDGGLYGTGTVVRKYIQGDEMEIVIEVTTHHRGWFVFKLCPVEEGVESNQDCLDQYPLEIVGNNSARYELPEGSREGIYRFLVNLPENLTCDRCVLQWDWTTGNRWGICDDKTGKLGCGPQEVFRGCADISIA